MILVRDLQSAVLDRFFFSMAILAMCLLTGVLFSPECLKIGVGHWDSWFTTALVLFMLLLTHFIVARNLDRRIEEQRQRLDEFDEQMADRA